MNVKKTANKKVPVNERGWRIGEGHPRSKLLDFEVSQVIELVEGGLSLSEVAKKFDVSKSCIQHIVDGSRRNQTVAKLKTIEIEEK